MSALGIDPPQYEIRDGSNKLQITLVRESMNTHSYNQEKEYNAITLHLPSSNEIPTQAIAEEVLPESMHESTEALQLSSYTQTDTDGKNSNKLKEITKEAGTTFLPTKLKSDSPSTSTENPSKKSKLD